MKIKRQEDFDEDQRRRAEDVQYTKKEDSYSENLESGYENDKKTSRYKSEKCYSSRNSGIFVS